jgi:hypothetical protein
MPRVVIISEGVADDEFLKALIAVRGLGSLEVLPPAREQSYGKDGFEDRLRGLKLGGVERSKAVIIVADNDEDPGSSFRNIQSQVRDAGDYFVPEQPYQISVRGAYPPVGVVMLPGPGEQGSLDTLCWSAANTRYSHHIGCVEATAACLGADEQAWGKVKLAKLKVQCLLSSVCKGDPYTPLKCAWWLDPPKGRFGDMFPLDHPAFSPIAEFLRRVAGS